MVRFAGDYDVIDNVEVSLKDKDVSRCNDEKEKGQQHDQSKGTPDVVYTAVDKSKKKKKGKTDGASATTTQGVDIEEQQLQHYECSDVPGVDWFGNAVGKKSEVNHGDHGKGSPSSEAQHGGPQSEPCNTNEVYAVVDKSKKKKKGRKN